MMNSIWIIEDDATAQMIAEMWIRQIYPEVELRFFYNGKEALTAIENGEEQPSCVFLDLNMPIMNGQEFLKQITEREYTLPNITICTSSERETDQALSAKYKNVIGYIVKPIDLGKLKDTFSSLGLPMHN